MPEHHGIDDTHRLHLQLGRQGTLGMSTMKASTPALILAAVVVAGIILGMVGACSMHDPGPYEGGGRNLTAPLPSSTTTPDSGPQDVFVPPDTGPDVKID
jgi:hypothetical protein